MTDTPIFNALRNQRLACALGIVSAQACLDDPWLAPYQATYQRLIATYQARIVEIDQRLALLPITPVYAGGRKDKLQALMRGYRQRHVTPREFGMRLRYLMGGR